MPFFSHMIDPESIFHFHIQQKNSLDEGFEAHWSVPADLPYFDGHFPGQPILPAVAILDANHLFLKQVLPRPFKIHKVVAAKFTLPVTPHMKIRMFACKKTESTWICEWKESKNDSNPETPEKTIAIMTLSLV